MTMTYFFFFGGWGGGGLLFLDFDPAVSLSQT